MTGYTVHTGTSKKFTSGWDKIFGDDQKSGKSTTAGAKKTKKKKANKKKS